MMQRMLLFMLVVFAPIPAFAQFEGTLEMTMTHRHGSGSMRLHLSKVGVRSEVRVAGQGSQMDMVFLHLFKNADVAYRIDDAQKTYIEVDLKAARDARKTDATYQATKLGVETVRGYSCVHAKVTDAEGNATEIWTSKEIANYRDIAKMMGPNAPANEGMTKALREIGADGFPVKVIHKSTEPTLGETSMELMKVEKKAPPASMFQLPAGYKKLEVRKHEDSHGGPPGAPGGKPIPPEMRKQLEEQLKSMTPEQREAAKRFMQQQGIQID